MDASCQTDLFLHRPPSPPYVPAKIGCDIGTEIADGDLFDFDAEVQPVVEALVGRTIEQALIEVLHEEELAEMKMQQQVSSFSISGFNAHFKKTINWRLWKKI